MISPPTRAFWTILCSGLGFVILTVMAREAWHVFWTDFAQHNPNRSQAHALMLVPLFGMIGGLGIALVQLSGALVTAAAITAAIVRRLGQAPMWTVPLLLPVCALVIYGQDAQPPHSPLAFRQEQRQGSLMSWDRHRWIPSRSGSEPSSRS